MMRTVKMEDTTVPVFLFPGQGAQFSGMGMDLYDADVDGSTGVRALFDLATKILGSDIRSLLNADPETLKQTDVSQVAITVASLAAARALASRGIKPMACAGFSLGEYSALALSGIISEADAIMLTVERGRIMQAVCAELAAAAEPSGSATEGSASGAGMAAVIGLSPAQVDSVIAGLGIDCLWGANYNSPLQTVISGTAEALAKAEEAFKAAGARRVLRLKVAGPFHSPLMAKAGEKFSAVLDKVTFADPAIPVFSNVTGQRIMSGGDARKCAVLHISNPVRWTEEEEAIAAVLGTDGSLIEVGPGKVLSGLWADSKLPGACLPYGELLK